MELENRSSLNRNKCCECDCDCSTTNGICSGAYLRSVKRKYDEFEEETMVEIPGNARVEIGDECEALREMVSNQQQAINDLIAELEEERNAAASAANEAMSMILRLQHDKAEVQMEATQFKRFAEEKMAHDDEEVLALEDLLYKREQAIHSLTCEVQAYRHRLLSYGLAEAEVDGDRDNGPSVGNNLKGSFDFPSYNIYPPLKCGSNQFYPDGVDEMPDVEKYAFGETPRSQDQLKDLEERINQLERSPRAAAQSDGDIFGAKNMFEKIIVGHSPRRPSHLRKCSVDSSTSLLTMTKEAYPDFARDSPKCFKTEFSNVESPIMRKVDCMSQTGDDLNDRVYTVDSVYQRASFNGRMDPRISSAGNGCDDYMKNLNESGAYSDIKDLEIQKLYARLHALEADRETMRQTMISIGTEKAQMALLKEIAQSLYKEMSPSSPRGVHVRRHSAVGGIFFMPIFKWIAPVFFWRRKSRRCKYTFGLSVHNAGLLLVLDRSPRLGQWITKSNTHVQKVALMI